MLPPKFGELEILLLRPFLGQYNASRGPDDRIFNV